MNRTLFAPFAALLLGSVSFNATGTDVATGQEPVAASSAGTAATELHRLFDAEWERGLRENPIAATYLGDHRFDDRWPDLSPAAMKASYEADQAVIRTLDGIDPSQLSSADQLNRDLFRRLYLGSIASYEFGAQYTPLTQRSRLLSTQEMAKLQELRTVQDYETWLRRIEGVDRYIEQNITLLREGVRRGQVAPRIIVQRTPAQIRQQIVGDAAQSPFYEAFAKMPDSIPAADQARLQAAARAAITNKVVPAYSQLLGFVEKEYLPRCRDTVGLWDTPGGAQWYQNRVRWYTTTDLTADQIHELGLREVARIRAEMLQVIARTGFKGSFEEFLTYLRTDPRFHYDDPQQLLIAYMAMAKRIDPLLPQYFGRLPRIPYGVRPIPAQAAPDTTTAYYQGGGMDGRRAGYYYVNLYKPEERPKYEIPVLTIHEAVPGHHLQTSLAKELGDLPKFRRDFEATAFVEGWGLYSESLGEEMGLYEDPYDKFGQLTYEMWRAVRLVVDTGLHAKQWPRQKAIDFFKANAAKTELDIVNEIDRYIATPGQALAYKIGELRIKELRREAAAALGPQFDLRAFHDVVLGSGAIPLDVLSANVHRWLDETKAASGTAAK